MPETLFRSDIAFAGPMPRWSPVDDADTKEFRHVR